MPCLCDTRPNVRSQAQDLVTPQECPLEMGGFPLDPRFFDREPTRQYWWVTFMLGVTGIPAKEVGRTSGGAIRHTTYAPTQCEGQE